MERENYQRLSAVHERNLQAMRDLGAQIEQLEQMQLRLDKEAVRAEALEERGWHDKAAAAEKNRKEIAGLKTAVDKEKAKDRIVEEERAKSRDAIYEEIVAELRPKFEAALKKLYETLKLAIPCARTLQALEDEAYADTLRYSGTLKRRLAFMPEGVPNLFLLLDSDQGLPEFKRIAKANGYELD